MAVPTELVPAVRGLIKTHERERGKTRSKGIQKEIQIAVC